MKSFFPLLVGILLSAVTLAGSASAAPSEALPPTLRASLPQKATSFLLRRLPLGNKGALRLVHVWGAVRPNTPDSLNSYNPYLPSPFCVDIFEPRLNANKQSDWHLVSSTSYTDVAPPTRLASHWLHPQTKRGPILEIVSSNGAPGVSIEHTLFVWNKGFQNQNTFPVPQTFWSGGSGGGLIQLKFDAVSGGSTIIEVIDSFAGKTTSSTKYRWNGERFSAIKLAG